jgi:hypothetical protein
MITQGKVPLLFPFPNRLCLSRILCGFMPAGRQSLSELYTLVLRVSYGPHWSLSELYHVVTLGTLEKI